MTYVLRIVAHKVFWVIKHGDSNEAQTPAAQQHEVEEPITLSDLGKKQDCTKGC